MSEQQHLERLLSIMAQLRDPQSGCPWDCAQDFVSIAPYTLEETYEVLDAIDKQDWPALKDELGDLLFQVIFYAQMGKEQGHFEMADILTNLAEKLTRRHPHVFANTALSPSSAEAVSPIWEAEKAKERAAKGQVHLLDDIPRQFPALMQAEKIQKRCAKVGFDWDQLPPVVDKVREEIDEVMAEVEAAQVNPHKVQEEVGDLLFAVVNLARHVGVKPEMALRQANDKFMRRFRGVEDFARAEKKN